MKQEILILYASIGTGHYHAALAIAEALLNLQPKVNLQIIDIFPNHAGNKWVQNSFAILSSYLFPNLYTKIWTRGALSWLYNLAVHVSPNSVRIRKILNKKKPELVICTHTFPCSVVVNWKLRKKSETRIAAVATDYAFNKYWPLRFVEIYFSPCFKATLDLISRGVPPKNIYTVGIPVAYRKKQTKQKMSQNSTVTVIFGSRAQAPYKYLYPFLVNLIKSLQTYKNNDIQWNLIFGTNQKWLNVAQSKLQLNKNIQILGFVENMASFIQKSDLVVSKPGGLTIGETLANGKPIALLGQGSGQEIVNCQFVTENDCGVLIMNPQETFSSIIKIIKNTERINLLKQNAKNLGSADSTAKVVKILLGNLHE